MGSLVLLILLSYAFGFAAYWHYLFIFNPRFDTFYAYVRDLLGGHTEWVADQNRVLAPILILGLQKFFHIAYENAYQHLMHAFFIGQNLCAALLFRRCGLTLGQALVGLLLVTTVPLALMNLWWFPWTNLEFILVLLVFVVDATRVTTLWRCVLYAALFAAWMLTKETAFLLPIWLGLRYGLPALAERRWRDFIGLAVLCIAMVVVSGLVVSGLRQWLWVSGSNPGFPSGMPSDLPTVLGGTHLYSANPSNLNIIIKNVRGFLTFRLPWPLWGNGRFVDWSVGMIEMLTALLITAGCTVWALVHRQWRLLALAGTALIYILALFAITNTAEADKLMPVVAIGAYAYALLAGQRDHLLVAAREIDRATGYARESWGEAAAPRVLKPAASRP